MCMEAIITVVWTASLIHSISKGILNFAEGDPAYSRHSCVAYNYDNVSENSKITRKTHREGYGGGEGEKGESKTERKDREPQQSKLGLYNSAKLRPKRIGVLS